MVNISLRTLRDFPLRSLRLKAVSFITAEFAKEIQRREIAEKIHCSPLKIATDSRSNSIK